MKTIPKRFIRIWLGNKKIPDLFETWWGEFKSLHPKWEFITITDNNISDYVNIPDSIRDIYNNVGSYAGRSDILRILILYEIGGIYIDTDIMPLKSFDNLTNFKSPFIALRSKKSFESAVIGAPKKHPALMFLIKVLPQWYKKNGHKACSVATGPTFISNFWFGKKGIIHLPTSFFYPYNGFMAPKKEIKYKIFSDKNNFPTEMYAAHFSNHVWGGKPKINET